jgi:hypothetical protein
MSHPLSSLQLLLRAQSKLALGEIFESVFAQRQQIEAKGKGKGFAFPAELTERTKELFETSKEETDAVLSLYFLFLLSALEFCPLSDSRGYEKDIFCSSLIFSLFFFPTE